MARLATKAESEAARVAAIKELLDRGYGRAVQPIQGTMEDGVSQQLAELLKENATGTLGSLRVVLCRRRMVSTTRNCTSRDGYGRYELRMSGNANRRNDDVSRAVRFLFYDRSDFGRESLRSKRSRLACAHARANGG